MKQKILIIVGPTASGKSALGVELARIFNGEVISADSRQVYRGLDIGTGKITKKEMKGIPHLLLDIVSPKKKFSAHDYVIHANRAIAHIACRKKIPMLVGGTGYYIDALLGRIAFPDVVPDEKLRALLEKKTTAQLFEMLKKKDRARSRNIESGNKRRLVRALEIIKSLGRVPQTKPVHENRFDAKWIGLTYPLPILEKRIGARLQTRIKAGMVREGERLHKSGLSYKRMEELGLEYRALSQLLQRKISRAQFETELQRNIRRYAKKQMMYWKRNPDIAWFAPTQVRKITEEVRSWLTGKPERATLQSQM